jgi:sugar/nucleoside kinase (ribokinase family)
LLHAKANGATTSIDLIAPGALGTLDAIAAALPHCDYLLPNAEQVIGFTGAVDLTEGAHILLDAGVGMIAATDGADGAVLFEGCTSRHIPAHDVPVIDTTGCGDAFSAGFLYAMGVGRPPVAAVQLGTAVAALVAQGLGSDHGDFTLDTADAFAAAAPTRPSGS